MSDNVSELAFQGFLEKSGLSINEAEILKQITVAVGMSFLECQAQYRMDGAGKNAKMSAAITQMLGSIKDSCPDDHNFLLLKGCIACAAYQVGNSESFEYHLSWIKDGAHGPGWDDTPVVEAFLSDETKLQILKEQYIKSKALGTRKGVWSKIFG